MIRFQTATIHDAKNIADLVNSAYRGEHAKKGWTTEAYILAGQRTDQNAVEELIKAPGNQIELIFQGRTSNLLGTVHLVLDSPQTLYFGMLTIEPGSQSQGLGKILLRHTEDIARAYGCKTIRCTVISSREELIAYYKRQGFYETGNFEEFPQDQRYGIPLVQGIKLQEFEKQLRD